MTRPIIGISPDREDGRITCAPTYAAVIHRAGGVPVILAHEPELVRDYVKRCAAFVLTGGDDPIMEHWGVETHPKAKKVDPLRQAFEVALLTALTVEPDVPVLGVCLGMQMMTLMAGGVIDQHLPDSHPDLAPCHWGKTPHPVSGDLGWGFISGVVQSHHRQVMTDPGALQVVATSPDGVIEAVRDPARRFALGVQWHPERTAEAVLGSDIFHRLVVAAESR